MHRFDGHRSLWAHRVFSITILIVSVFSMQDETFQNPSASVSFADGEASVNANENTNNRVNVMAAIGVDQAPPNGIFSFQLLSF